MDWGEMMRGALRMGVSPQGFWSLSLREWRILVSGSGQGAPLGRAELEALMQMWPDEGGGDERV